MKKLALYSLVALGLAFAACDEVEDATGTPVVNPQEPVFEASNVTVTNSAVADAVIDLSEYMTEIPDPDTPDTPDADPAAVDQTPIEIAAVEVKDLPEGYTLAFAMQMAKDETFADPAEIPAVYADGKVFVMPEDVENGYWAKITHSPKERAVAVRYAAYIVNEENPNINRVRIGGPDFFYGPLSVKILPLDRLTISPTYYLVGTANGWDWNAGIQFEHSDADVYDDPVFVIKNIDVDEATAEAGWWWKIIPVNGKEENVVGVSVNGDDALEGTLDDKAPQAGALKEAGRWNFYINMEEMTYRFEKVPAVLYVPNKINGWPDAGIVFSGDYTSYQGLAGINPGDGGFKFKTEAGVWYGAGEEAGTLTTDGSAGNLGSADMGPTGLYYLTANTEDMTYTYEAISSVALIGNATDAEWDPAAAVELTPSDDFETWTVTTHLKAGEFKFMTEHDWGKPNLGGSLDDLRFGAGNCSFTGAEGEYVITLSLAQFPYSCTVQPK